MDSLSASVASEMNGWQIFLCRLRGYYIRLRRKCPYVVWYDDELDVTVTFSREHLLPDGSIDDAFRTLFGSRLAVVEKAIGDMDIGFDRGVGFDGRDWEWDWSLRGPISVRFRSRATKPERRRERPRPKLVCSS